MSPLLDNVIPVGSVEGVQAPFPKDLSEYVGGGNPVLDTW